MLSNGYLTVLLCTVQLDSSLFTLFILKLSASAPSARDQLKAGSSFLQAPAIHEWGYQALFYLQSAHLRKYFIIQFSGSKANASLFPLVLPASGDPSFSISLFTFVAVVFSGCQAPGKTGLTDLFIGTLLPALKCIEFVFWNPTALWEQCYPGAAHLCGPSCCDVCPGFCPARLWASGCAPHFLYVGAACALKGSFLSGREAWNRMAWAKYVQMGRIKLRALETGSKPFWKCSQLG